MSHFRNETLFIFTINGNTLFLTEKLNAPPSYHRLENHMENQELHTDHCNHAIIEKRQENFFLYTTITGNLQLVHFEEIGYFRYNSKSKLWEVVLYNKHTLVLKRNTNSQKILGLHPYFLQISQSYIINITYLASIEDNNCLLLPPFNSSSELLQVSKSFLKKLKEKYPCL